MTLRYIFCSYSSNSFCWAKLPVTFYGDNITFWNHICEDTPGDMGEKKCCSIAMHDFCNFRRKNFVFITYAVTKKYIRISVTNYGRDSQRPMRVAMGMEELGIKIMETIT